MKQVCFYTVLFFLNNPVYSQASEKVHFGIRLGVATSNSKFVYVNNNPGYNYSSKTGLMFGGFADIPVSKMWVFQPAFLYVRKGIKENNQFYYSISNNYLELPLNLLFMTSTKNKGIYLGAGCSPAFAANSQYASTGLKKFDLGLNVLTGYKFPIGLSVDVNYTYGLLNLSDNKDYLSDVRNRYLGISLGYLF